MQRALDYADKNFPNFVAQLEDLLRIPSISANPQYAADVRRAADWLVRDLRSIGVQSVELFETAGQPIIVAEHLVDPSFPTILVYGHYDVQPPDPLELWESPPFEPAVRNGDLYARGACDDKGQLFMHVKALESWLKSGEPLPVNIKMLIEGEEEVGSATLAPFIKEHATLLAADVAVISDTSMFAPGVPSITSGLRGISYVEVELTGPDRDLHSGSYGGAVENPVNVLGRLIAGLHDADFHITVPGFYDGVKPLSAEEQTAFELLPFDEIDWMESIGIHAARTDGGISIHEAITAHPTLDVNGIWGGYSGPGAKTVLPSKAGAKISMRLVPGQDPIDAANKLRSYFEQNKGPTVQMKFTYLQGGKPVLIDTTLPAMQAAADAIEDTTGTRPLFSREGGTIPVVADFKEILGLDTVMMGFGLDSDAIHSPNEKFGLDRFRMGIESIIRFYRRYASQDG